MPMATAGAARPATSYLPPRPVVDKPLPPQKSAEDLKAILRKMTEKSGVEKEKKQEEKQHSLKGALTTALQNPVAVKPPQEEKKPFEVPEDKLREVLKGDI